MDKLVMTQLETIHRSFLQTFDVPKSSFETVIGISELAPNVASGRQSHPGFEGGYVLQGDLTILVDGQPPLRLSAGQSWNVAPRLVHDAQSGADGAKAIVTWVVEKGEPLVSPAS